MLYEHVGLWCARRNSKQSSMQGRRPLRIHVLRRKLSGQARVGPKNAIFDLSMPSQIRWAVSQRAPNFVIALSQSELR
jgi:hypothetical protein